MMQLYRPNTGVQVRHEPLSDVEKKYKKITSDEAMNIWIQQYDDSINTCTHAYWRGSCRNATAGNECEVKIILIYLRVSQLFLFPKYFHN